MTDVEILAFIVTPIVAVLFAWGMSSYGLWDLKRSRRARLKQG